MPFASRNKPANSAALPSPDDIDFPDDHDAISARAYALWENSGRGHGRDREHWLQAQQEIRNARRSARDEREGLDESDA